MGLATRGRTTVLVIHDPGAIPEMDQIVVLDAGRVVQRGTHREPLRLAGLHRQMWEVGLASDHVHRLPELSPAAPVAGSPGVPVRVE